MIFLDRAYPPDQRAVLGLLRIGTWTCHTLELPWRMNEPNRSCIPEGTYALRLRPDLLIQRMAGGDFTDSWEVQNVPDRSYITFHPGEWVEDSQGGIILGRKAEWANREGHVVTSSTAVFAEFMKQMSTVPADQRLLSIRVRAADWV